jgi:glycosyltransferase involved in cell wall biosynthesis
MCLAYESLVESDRIRELREMGMTAIPRTRWSPPSLYQKVQRRLDAYLNINRKAPWLSAIEAFGPDVVCLSHGNTYELFDESGIAGWLQESGVPRVHVCQLNTEFFSPGEALRKRAIEVYERAYKVLFVSEENRKTTIRQLGAEIGNAAVIRNPVNLLSREAEPFPSGATTTLQMAVVARLDIKYKGHDLLFEVLSEPVWRTRNWCLNLYGDGMDREHICRLINLFDLGGRVKLHGHVTDVRSIWRTNHIQVLPSRAEGTPLALVEAMLVGRPAVVTDVGGNAEWVEEGRSGFVAEGCTVRSLRGALERMWDAREDLSVMGQRARAFALAHVDLNPGATLLQYLRDTSVARGFDRD